MEKLFVSPSLPQTNKTKQTNEQTRKCSTPRGTYSRRGFCPASGRSPQTDRPRGSWGGVDSVPACPPRRVVFMYIIPLAFHHSSARSNEDRRNTKYPTLSNSVLLSFVMFFHIFHMKNIYMALHFLKVYATNYDHGKFFHHIMFNKILHL